MRPSPNLPSIDHQIPLMQFFRSSIAAAVLLTSSLVIAAETELIPTAVQRLANSYFDALPKEEQPTDRAAAIKQYAGYFFEGFSRPKEEGYNGTWLMPSALSSGRAWWIGHPDRRDEIFLGFGYRRVDVVGTYKQAVEWNSFIPDGDGREMWEVRFIGDPKASPWKGLSSECGLWQTCRLRVVGYVSPVGSYGHRGMSRVQMLATSIERADD